MLRLIFFTMTLAAGAFPQTPQERQRLSDARIQAQQQHEAQRIGEEQRRALERAERESAERERIEEFRLARLRDEQQLQRDQQARARLQADAPSGARAAPPVPPEPANHIEPPLSGASILRVIGIVMMAGACLGAAGLTIRRFALR